MSITLFAIYSRAGKKFLRGLEPRSQSKIITLIRVWPQHMSLLSDDYEFIGRNLLPGNKDTTVSYTHLTLPTN